MTPKLTGMTLTGLSPEAVSLLSSALCCYVVEFDGEAAVDQRRVIAAMRLNVTLCRLAPNEVVDVSTGLRELRPGFWQRVRHWFDAFKRRALSPT